MECTVRIWVITTSSNICELDIAFKGDIGIDISIL